MPRTKRTRAEPVYPEGARGSGLILIVHDSDLRRKIAAGVLRLGGFDPHQVHDVEEGERLLEPASGCGLLLIDETLLKSKDRPQWRELVERWAKLRVLLMAALPDGRSVLRQGPRDGRKILADWADAKTIVRAVSEALVA